MAPLYNGHFFADNPYSDSCLNLFTTALPSFPKVAVVDRINCTLFYGSATLNVILSDFLSLFLKKLSGNEDLTL